MMRAVEQPYLKADERPWCHRIYLDALRGRKASSVRRTFHDTSRIDLRRPRLRFANHVGPEHATERAQIAARCVGRVPANRLADVGNRAIEQAPQAAAPSTAIIMRLVACGSRPY